MAFAMDTRLSRAGSAFGQTVGLGIATLSFLTMPGGWPTSGPWVFLAWIVAGLTLLYLLVAVWQLVKPPSEEIILFRSPRTAGTWHDIKWIDKLLKRIKMDRRSRARRVEERIARYMAHLLSDASRARILTRDLSWCKEADEELRGLASTGSLTIVRCESGNAPISENIKTYQDLGARVCTTSVGSAVRMTTVDKGGARIVAIGHRDGRTHVIRQTGDPREPSFGLVDTLFNALIGAG